MDYYRVSARGLQVFFVEYVRWGIMQFDELFIEFVGWIVEKGLLL